MSKIVIVDDVLSNALLIKGYLKALAVDTEIFTDANLALVWCAKHEIDLVFLDFRMPGMGGTEFLRLFRTNEYIRDVPVIVVTWDEGKDTLHQALKAGASDVLHKPIDRIELIVRTQNLLELQWRRRALMEANVHAEKLNAELAEKLAKIEAMYDLITHRDGLGTSAVK